MNQFNKRVGKLLSNGMNEKDYVHINSVSKQQFDKQKQQRIEKIRSRKLQNDKYILLKGYQNLIRKFNNNLMLLRKFIVENKKISQMLKHHSKIKNKVSKIYEMENLIGNMQETMIFMDDIDEKIVEQLINKG